MQMNFLDAASDWGERKDVPVSAFRSEAGDWYVKLDFKDSRGWFSATVASFEPQKKTKQNSAEMDEAFAKRVNKALDDACVRTRHDRLVQMNGCDPRVSRAA